MGGRRAAARRAPCLSHVIGVPRVVCPTDKDKDACMNWNNQRAHLSQLSRPLAFKRAPAHRSPCSPWPANTPHRARSRVLRGAGGAQVAAKVAGWRDAELQPRALEEGVARVVDGFERAVGLRRRAAAILLSMRQP